MKSYLIFLILLIIACTKNDSKKWSSVDNVILAIDYKYYEYKKINQKKSNDYKKLNHLIRRIDYFVDSNRVKEENIINLNDLLKAHSKKCFNLMGSLDFIKFKKMNNHQKVNLKEEYINCVINNSNYTDTIIKLSNEIVRL